MSAAALYADTLTAPDANTNTGAGIPGWVVLLDCHKTQRECSDRVSVEIVLQDDGHLTIDRNVELTATKPCHFAACYSEHGVLMFGKNFPPMAAGDQLVLEPSGVFAS